MLELGPPTIRVVDMGDHLAAIEGCHRVEVAARLGLPLRVTILNPEDLVSGSSLDWSDLDPDSEYSASWLGAEVRSGRESVEYRLFPDGRVCRSGSRVPAGPAFD